MSRADLQCVRAVPAHSLRHALYHKCALVKPWRPLTACCFALCCADYGVVCCWGLTAKQEQDILSSLAKKAQQQPLPPREVCFCNRVALPRAEPVHQIVLSRLDV